jgi:hypothetical protein
VSTNPPDALRGVSGCHIFAVRYSRACSNFSRKNILSLSKVWLVVMATNGLPFETLGSIPPGKFNFIGLRTDRKRRRSKCSEKLPTFPAKSEPLTAERSANLLRLNAAYLTMFTVNNVEHVVCRRSRGGLPLDQSVMVNLYFSTCFEAAFHLFCPVRTSG